MCVSIGHSKNMSLHYSFFIILSFLTRMYSTSFYIKKIFALTRLQHCGVSAKLFKGFQFVSCGELDTRFSKGDDFLVILS